MFAARGGEEIVVILPTAGLDGARARAERLRSKMRELNLMYQGKSLGTVTFSVGVAAFLEHGMSPRICWLRPMPLYTKPNAVEVIRRLWRARKARTR